MTATVLKKDYKVADISLADWGRKEIAIAESEMPALMAIRAKYRDAKPLQGSQNYRLHSHDHSNRSVDRNAAGVGGSSAVVILQYFFYSRPCGGGDCGGGVPPCLPGRAKPKKSTGGAWSKPAVPPPMVSCGDANMNSG